MGRRGSLVLALALLWTAAEACDSGYIRCASGDRCVKLAYLCDGDNDCGDMSDENICSVTRTNRQLKHLETIPGQTSTTGMMTTTYETTLPPTTTLPPPPPPNNVEESEALGQRFARTFNDTLHHPRCPKLYTSVGNKCLSLLYFVKVGWGEASALCSAIGGKLVAYPSASEGEFAALLKYLREIQMTTDFWVGGRYTKDTEAWTWLDDAPMDLGSPYWPSDTPTAAAAASRSRRHTPSLKTSPTGPTLRPATTTSRRRGATPSSSAPPSPSATTSTLATRTAWASGALCVNMFPAPLMTSRSLAVREHLMLFERKTCQK
nr:uncharacterized protein LOC113823075 isoform X2 [Penaeus vannamei]XP_027231489.1 uncharacterized protein LOC113823075 isoform X2 [Penaeus vannamei]XP_027231490.1 uncharacterized protein LOC113823075 isoform X2 [Penaeus vannamei]